MYIKLEKIYENFAILVLSCDKYSDLWGPFFSLFWRFWPDCPFTLYLLSNTIGVDDKRVKNLLVGKDISWSDNLINSLNQLKEHYILLFMDDLFLIESVKTDKFIKLLKTTFEINAKYVTMDPLYKPDKHFNDLVGLISKGAIYRASTVLTIWDRSVLLELLKNGESAWDFEIYGTIRSDKYDDFYATCDNYFNVINGVIKGKWQRSAIRKIRSLGVEIDLIKRNRMTFSETILFYFKRQQTKILYLLPAQYRRAIKDVILRGKYEYNLREYNVRK
jgi:hypothetical protein